MKLSETFEVAKPVDEVWAFIDQPEAVAGCVPGVEQLSVRTPDDIDVRITQSIGPMNATFAASVQITDREPEKRINFTAQGKTVRGAMGNVRAGVEVSLVPSAAGTEVTVDGDVALAGALGSVGQKVVAKQAGKVTAEFARNLASALGAPALGAPAVPTASTASSEGTTAPAAPSASAGTSPMTGVRALPPVSDVPAGGPDVWVKATAVFSAITAVAAVAILLRGRSK